MCRLLFVGFMLILVLDALPWRPRRQKYTSQAVTTRRFVKTYTRSKSGQTTVVPMMTPTEVYEYQPVSITPVDVLTAARCKEPILHKVHRKGDFATKPFEIDGVIICGINDWFILDDFNEYYADEDYYEYYKEYIEEFWEETIYEYDEDDS